MRKLLNVVSPRNVKVRTCYTGKILSSCFKTKDRMKFDNKYDIIWINLKCPEEAYSDDFIGESGIRVIQRVKGHCGRDQSSHMLGHSIEKNHTKITVHDVKVIGHNYRDNVRKWKFVERLLIKQFWPTLNVHEQSVALKLLNWYPAQ